MPDDHQAVAIHTTSGRRLTMDCGTWRDIVRRINRGTGKARVTQILACLKAVVRNGSPRELRGAGSWRWRWGASPDDEAVVVADLAGRIAFASPGGDPAHIGLAWRQCATATR